MKALPLAFVVTAIALSGCAAFSPYRVAPIPPPNNVQTVRIGDKALVTFKSNGDIVWHEDPEVVVRTILVLANQQQEQLRQIAENAAKPKAKLKK